MQKITSEKTSRNIISRGLKLVPKTCKNHLNYGGGKFDKGTQYLMDKGIKSGVYDPYNRTKTHNDLILSRCQFDCVSCDNVLNVIQSRYARKKVLRHIRHLLKNDYPAIFVVYEGDKSGKGAITRDGYQNNKKTSEYIEEISMLFSQVKIVNNAIIATK